MGKTLRRRPGWSAAPDVIRMRDWGPYTLVSRGDYGTRPVRIDEVWIRCPNGQEVQVERKVDNGKHNRV